MVSRPDRTDVMRSRNIFLIKRTASFVTTMTIDRELALWATATIQSINGQPTLLNSSC